MRRNVVGLYREKRSGTDMQGNALDVDACGLQALR